MADANDAREIGYGKPPKHTQFTKGQSGNPKGRPKGSQNLATILAKACRQRVKVTENGRTRYITKLEASVTQLNNQAASGELRAIRELFYWNISLANSEQAALPLPVPHESDNAVMASILERIRQSDSPPSDMATDSSAADPSRKEV